MLILIRNILGKETAILLQNTFPTLEKYIDHIHTRKGKPYKVPNDLKDEILGTFCADAGLVGVFLLDEVLKANPNFDYHITKPHTTTLIEDFDGDVSYITEMNKETQDEFAYIVGTGNINFITAQTGF